MSDSEMPLILHVDDEPDLLEPWQERIDALGNVEMSVVGPDDVTEDALRRASLVLVDFKLEHWAGRDKTSGLALKPVNGLALLSVLQEKAYELDKARPRAFAVFTAAVQDVARGLVPQAHIIARAQNLEWIFDKADLKIDVRAKRAAELAVAASKLPKPWPGDASHSASTLSAWLALPEEAPWKDSAWQAVLDCRPPIHEFAEHTHGIAVLRWALHKILPYPTFLIDDAHLAARMRVDLASLSSQLEDSPQLAERFGSALYKGSLAGFVGRRWWRAGIESVIFDLASTDPGSIAALHEQLANLAPGLVRGAAAMMFPVIDEKFFVKGTLATADDVMRVVPDDWPPFADAAWALRSDVASHPSLAAVTVGNDDQEA